ncbi:MAG: methyl-accepting chemotaxis protein [Bacilli bacterium]
MVSIDGILEKLAFSMSFFQNLFPEDAHVLLCDTERVLVSLPGKELNMGVREGTPLAELRGTLAAQAIARKVNVKAEMGPEKFGIPYIGIGIPLIEHGKAVGALSVAMSNARYEQLRTNANELATAVEELTATTDEIASASNNIAEKAQEASRAADEVRKFLSEIEGISEFVNELSTQTNLLGLNAAIEAARAGESGRGFSVVAEEIRKLSERTKKSNSQINRNLAKIKELIQQSNNAVHTISSDTEEHAATVEELKAIFEHIARMADNMVSLSQI